LLDGAQKVQLATDPKRKLYVQLIRGALQVNGTPLEGGDAALLEGESQLVLDQAQDAEVLVFDLAP
jgi:redox-sensitive bicupin YhaK (pirin superfamily)